MAVIEARRPGLQWLLIGGAVIVLLAGLEFWVAPRSSIEGLEDALPVRTPLAGLASSYGDELTRIDAGIASARERAIGSPRDWLPQEMLAGALFARARLTGDYADYAAAEAALARSFAAAPAGAGPHATQAGLDFAMHRLGAAERQLAIMDGYAIPPERGERADSEAMRGDIAFYRGDLSGAAAYYDRADALVPHVTNDRRAIFALRTGDAAAARRYFNAAEQSTRLPTRRILANYALQRGTVELASGRWDEAKSAFERADTLFPGYWLIEAHRAQAEALAGHTGEAIASFEAIAKRSGSPEAMDALAALYRYEGDAAAAGRWAGRAGKVWAERLRLFPEAAYGHALEHELAFGDPARALDLARRDFANRPYGGAATGLGWAWLANNRPSEALATITPVLRSRWRSAEAHLVAAQAYTLLGNGERAEAEQAAALAINPRALDPAAALIWFGH